MINAIQKKKKRPGNGAWEYQIRGGLQFYEGWARKASQRRWQISRDLRERSLGKIPQGRERSSAKALGQGHVWQFPGTARRPCGCSQVPSIRLLLWVRQEATVYLEAENSMISFLIFICFFILPAHKTSLIAMHRLLVAAASFAAELRLYVCRLQQLQHVGFSDGDARFYLPHSIWSLPGIEPMSPTLAREFLTTGQQGKSKHHLLIERKLFGCFLENKLQGARAEAGGGGGPDQNNVERWTYHL